MLLAILISLLIVLLAFPETSIGRSLSRLLVETTARLFSRITPGRVAFFVALILFGGVLIALFEIEGLRLFGFMAPETVAWFATFDVGLFLDVFLAAAAMTGSARLRAMAAQTRARLRSAPQRLVLVYRKAQSRARRVRSALIRPARSEDPDPFGGIVALT